VFPLLNAVSDPGGRADRVEMAHDENVILIRGA
jgi:hypothetical protein